MYNFATDKVATGLSPTAKEKLKIICQTVKIKKKALSVVRNEVPRHRTSRDEHLFPRGKEGIGRSTT